VHGFDILMQNILVTESTGQQLGYKLVANHKSVLQAGLFPTKYSPVCGTNTTSITYSGKHVVQGLVKTITSRCIVL